MIELYKFGLKILNYYLLLIDNINSQFCSKIIYNS